MANGNGTNGTFKIFGWIGGFVVFLLTLYTVFHQPLVKADAIEATTRINEDNRIEEKVNSAILEQKDVNTRILVALGRIETKVSNGRPD